MTAAELSRCLWPGVNGPPAQHACRLHDIGQTGATVRMRAAGAAAWLANFQRGVPCAEQAAVLLHLQGRELLLTASDRIGVYRCDATAVELRSALFLNTCLLHEACVVACPGCRVGCMCNVANELCRNFRAGMMRYYGIPEQFHTCLQAPAALHLVA
jgi:hypothetical protein